MDPLSLALVLGVALTGVAGTLVAARKVASRARWNDEAPPSSRPTNTAAATESSAEKTTSADNSTALVPHPDWKLLRLGLGDVVQHETESRWFCSGLVAHQDKQPFGGLLLCRANKRLLAAFVFAKSNPNIFWLEESPLQLAGKAPTRIELGDQILDRDALHICRIHSQGQEAPTVSEGRLGLYRNARGAVAIVLQTSGPTLSFLGIELTEDAYDCLGDVPIAGTPLAEA